MTKTVFVLGAGASVGYGMPTGKKLKDILSASDAKWEPSRAKGTILAEPLLGVLNGRTASVRERLSRTVWASIDEFVAHLEREDDQNCAIRDIARELIALQLLLDETALTRGLYATMFRACYFKPPPRGHVPRPDTAIVTFNYDPTLEKAFRRIGGDEYPDRFHLEQSMPKVLHIHGRLPWFDFQPNSAEIFDAAKEIRPISRTSANPPHIVREARQLIEHAQRVVFLGFGYIKENMELLGIAEHEEGWTSRQSQRVVRGTAFELTGPGREYVEKVLRAGASDMALGGHNVECEEYLQQLDAARMRF